MALSELTFDEIAKSNRFNSMVSNHIAKNLYKISFERALIHLSYKT